MKTLLVPTDFSIVADNALKYALDMATAYQFDVMLLHVMQLASPTIASAIYLESVAEVTEHTNQKMEEKVASLKADYPNIQISYKAEAGLFLDTLERTCEEIQPIAVLMGITGSGVGLDKIIGSNVLLAMHSLKHPLIIVPKNGFYKPVENICFSCDLKNVLNSTPILPLKTFVKLFNAKLHILNIDFSNRNFEPQTAQELQNANELFSALNPEYHFVESEYTAEAINDFCEKNNIDMLIMLPKKHSFFVSLFRKSQTKEVIYQSQIPVITFHQP